jgi:hypothetical protein
MPVLSFLFFDFLRFLFLIYVNFLGSSFCWCS